MKQKKISVIVPCYNSGKFIIDTIEAIKAQTYINIEVILIDDGSSDNTYQLLNEICEGDSRFVVLQQENKGVSFSRNRGIRESSGDFIVFLDSDDIIPKHYLENFMNYANDLETIVSCEIKKFVDINITYNEIKSSINVLSLNDVSEITNYFTPFHNIKGFGSVVNKCYPRKLLINNELFFDEEISVGEDLCFNLSLLKKIKKWNVISNQFYYYRVNEGSLTFSFKPDYLKMRLKMIAMLTKVFDENKLSKETLFMEYIKAAYSQMMSLYITENKLTRHEKIKIIEDVKEIIPQKIKEKQLKSSSMIETNLYRMLRTPTFILSIFVKFISTLWLIKMKKTNA